MKKELCLAKLKQRTAKPGEVYAFYVEMLGKYGACQILAVDGKSICYALLDYLEDDLPENYYEERWKSFDETARSAYKKYVNSGDFVSVHGRMFRKNTGGLRELDFDSVPKEAGLYLKKHWKGKLDRLSVTHLRDEGWLKDNLENPFRHWDGNEFISAAAYRSARKCYKDTKKLLTEAMGRAADRKEIQEIVRGYTQSFNKLNNRYEEFIETEEREDVFMAMERLYEDCILQGEYGQADENAVPVTLSEIWNVMDEVRENW